MHIPTINSICGEVVSTAAFVLAQPHLPIDQSRFAYQGAYFRLVDGNSEAEKAAMFTTALGQAGAAQTATAAGQ
ncbi:hypothetical protein [Shewanella baltica]|uniref:hypothetical protein n=1 Tax=Shewanella baltica TaxID=62322 RepID=UPI0039AE97C9